MSTVPTISLVIPAKNAELYLPALLEAFRSQSPLAFEEVLVMDSQSADLTRPMCEAEPGFRVIEETEFCHAETRNRGARRAKGDIIVFLSQDARPLNSDWLSELVRPFSDPQVAAVYSRQIPYPDASPMESFFLAHRFPDGPAVVRRKKTGVSLTFESAFFSNVSSAVRRDLLLRHPFDASLIMSEDQQLSRDLLEAGFAVVYQPTSVVVHSHQYTLREVYQRYFDSVYSLRQIHQKHGVGESVSIGIRYVREEFVHILSKHPLQLPYYVLYTGTKAMATFMAHLADRLPKSWAKKMSLHKYYWDRIRP